MFCTKCGKELYEGDKFCAHCGAEVREPKRARYDDVVFNPPFKIEAEKRTEEILKTTETPKPEERKRETIDFNWNLEGFPSAKPRKTEDVDFNWDSVIEKRNSSRDKDAENKALKAEEEPEIPLIAELKELEAETQPQAEGEEENPISIEELERELFGDTKDEKEEPSLPEEKTYDERFYTYNQKVDAFQELLKKEKERLQNLEDSYNKEREAMDYTWAGEVFPDLKARSEEPAEEPAEEPVRVVGVTQPPVTMAVDLSSIVKETAEEQTMPSPSKTKLRYSDVFPRSLADDGGTGADYSAEKDREVNALQKKDDIYYDDEDDEESEKGHIFAKIVIAILIILIVIEGGIIAVKFIAPESKISLWANDVMLRAIDLVSGKDGDDPEEKADAADTDEVHMANLVAEASGGMKTIGEAVYSPDLKYSLLKDYSFEEIPSAEEFADADWQTDQSGKTITYGQELAEALINYYDGWQSSNKDKSLVGINKLEIGEIRTGTNCYYALCRVTYAGEDGNDVIKYQTACLKISGDAMIINEIKEENL